MAFLPNIPQSTDQISISQGNILNNFQILGSIAGNANANSSSLNASVGFNFVNFSLPGAAAITGANQMALYTGANANSGRQELYVIHQNSTVPVPMTAYALGGTNAGNGWTYLPSGLIMAWGRSTTGGANNVTITYSAELTNFPGFTTVFAFPQLTRISGAGTSTNFVTLTNYTQTTFQVYASAGSTGVQFAWMIIGI